jgi:diketogulonate reductase-like aldo/keto reductase
MDTGWFFLRKSGMLKGIYAKGGNRMNMNTTVTLNNQVQMPQLGLGVFKSEDGLETYNAVCWALEAGYRHIDTAKAYGNEASVGKAIRESGIPREQIFVTTKLWNPAQRDGSQEEAFYGSLKLLGLDYLDLYLIHWPVQGEYNKTWAIMEKLYKQKLIRAIGVSNFNPHHFETLMTTAEIVPAVNQIEMHPLLVQTEVAGYFAEKGVAIESWGPLGRGALIDHPAITAIAAQHGKTTAQIILRWHLQHGYIVIPKSVHKERIISNSDLYDFELTTDEMAALDALNQNVRYGPDPETFNF